MEKRYEVEYEYYDDYCRNGKWNKQTNIVYALSARDAVRKVVELNGLGQDCSYRILKVEEIG